MSHQDSSREIQEIWALFRRVAEQQEENARKIEKLHDTVNALTGKWGKFVEGLVEPGAIRIFKERGIELDRTYTRAKSQKNGREMEIDIIARNSEYVVAISVKSTLKVEDVNEHIEDLSEFRKFFPDLSDRKLVGAVAGIVIEEEADKYAYRKGLFVITQAGENIKVLNDDKFKPKLW